ncbi:hypothetical protein BKH21_02720 [Actinomyces oris]|nr:hypothetical protein BKH21_02720 [Actinomyces oris]
MALQVGVPFSLVKVRSGFAPFWLKLLSTQNSLRLLSLEAGEVIVMVLLTSWSDLMTISALSLSSFVSFARAAALLGGAAATRRSEVVR